MTQIGKIPVKHAKWLKSPALVQLFGIFEIANCDIRVNGGAVRNSVLGESIGDVDLSTPVLPQDVMKLLKGSQVKAIATGLQHGTITAVIDRQPFEITTLRRDIETDGRHAVVEFGDDWHEDAARRDLTMNALYCDRRGNLFDPLGGYDDLLNREIRFIGNAEDRIKEDYLRIMRFFRFFAQYGHGRPDGEGLKASTRLKAGLANLSVERVWMELKKILSVSDPSRALLWMRTTGVLNQVLPESEKWGIDFLPDMIGTEKDLEWQEDAMARLQCIVPPTVERMSELSRRLKFSTVEKVRMIDWAKSTLPREKCGKLEMAQILYRGSKQGVYDRLRMEIVRLRHVAREKESALISANKFNELLIAARAWERPEFPVKGRHLEEMGLKSGPEMGKKLAELEEKWIEGGFDSTRQELLS